MNNYNSGEANVRRGINISWSEYDTPSANKHVFTFDTPMADSNYAVVTDRPYENDNCVHIYNQSTTGFTAEWDYDNPEVFGEYFNCLSSTPTKTIGGSSSSTEILPVAFKYVHMGNYDAGVNDRKGINISWSEYDSSAQEHVFTFDTPMGDSNYVVVTDRSDYEDTNAIYIKYKSTTGFTAEWVGADPDVFSGSFIVYTSTPTKTIGGGKDWFDANDNLAGICDVYGTPYDETNAWNVKFTSMTGFNRKVKIETGDGLHSRIFPHSILETKTVDVSHIYTIHNLLNKPDIEIDVSSKTQFSLAIWHKMKEINNSYGIVKLNTNSQVVLQSKI